jgi:hypothetical protein
VVCVISEEVIVKAAGGTATVDIVRGFDVEEPVIFIAVT